MGEYDIWDDVSVACVLFIGCSGSMQHCLVTLSIASVVSVVVDDAFAIDFSTSVSFTSIGAGSAVDSDGKGDKTAKLEETSEAEGFEAGWSFERSERGITGRGVDECDRSEMNNGTGIEEDEDEEGTEEEAEDEESNETGRGIGS